MSTERARSLSPTKDNSSRTNTLGSIRSAKNLSIQEFSKTSTLQPPSAANGVPPDTVDQEIDTRLRGLPQPPSNFQTATGESIGTAMPLSRAGTLSWQQRPSSRGSTGPRSRPVSILTSDSDSQKPRQESTDRVVDGDGTKSRGQIAQSLGAKDPTWFMQTQDRGLGSAAYRKNQEHISDTASMTGSMRLPGMSRESTIELEDRMSPPMESVRSHSPYEYPERGVSRQAPNHSTSASISSAFGVRSPLPTLESQILEPLLSDTASSLGGDSSTCRPLAMSPSQGRISPERMDRPISPTKGLGGFVQSAMMKRSDSVNKRWSAQAGPGLSRGNSVMSDVSSYGTTRYPRGGITPLAESRPNGISGENSPAINSRPGSSQSNATVTRSADWNERPGSSTSLTNNKPEPVLNDSHPSLNQVGKPSPPVNDMTIAPASPSKRWSPSKASWLENAINKQDSPRAKLPAPQQPAWMADIARAKQQRGSVDLSKGTNFKEVAIGGLVRSPPPGAGYKPPSIGALSSGFNAGLASKPQAGILDEMSREASTPEQTNENAGSPTSHPAQVRSAAQAESETRPVESPRDTRSQEGLTDPPSVQKTVSGANVGMTSPTAAKTKPETPPKKDFKSTLKSRNIGAEFKDSDEPEFKNVFGKLKRTQTQNYVAPDEFRDNIMRGKAGLAQTGGPKKTERKDEFKESILQKKQKMVAPSASTRITSASSKTSDQSTPEAIAKRNALIKSDSMTSNGNANERNQAAKPEALAKLQHLRDKPEPIPPKSQSSASAPPSKNSGPKGALGGTFASSLSGVLQRGPSPMTGQPSVTPHASDISEKTSMPAANTEPTSTGPQLTHATKARAKGPKRRLPTSSKQSRSVGNESSVGASNSKQLPSENQPFGVSSVTKPRPSIINPSTPQSRPLSNITNSNNSNRKVSQPNSPRKPSTSIIIAEDLKPASPISQRHSREIQTNTSPVLQQKPPTSSKAKKNSGVVSSPPRPLSDTLSRRPAVQERCLSPVQQPLEQPKRGNDSPEPEMSLPSVKDAAALWGQSQKSAQSALPKSPVKLPTSKDEEAALEEARLKPTQTVRLGIKAPTRDLDTQQNRNGTSPAIQSPKSPPLPGKKPVSVTGRAASTHLTPTKMAQSSKSILTKSSDATELFASIFDGYPNSSGNTNVDTQTAVNSRASDDNLQKIKTLRKQISEVTSNGKSIPVPPQQEHILFEESLYLCTHIFGTPSGQRTTEVYLWCGDGVSSASVEDAQLFAKKVAKDTNGQLIVLKQGKETTNFFQALGGIVITRRGSSRRAAPSKSSGAGYMLCGRQHVGQIAFDEIDYSPQSLCTGFPYIVSTPSGKLYLWKGVGSGADELGCARLIGMDLGLTGDIEEIDEGREPDAFWKIFAEGNRNIAISTGTSPQHWHLRPSCEKYSTRLFATDSETPRPKSSSGFMSWGRRGSAPSSDANAASTMQVKEIMPFTQSDLVDGGIFVLDTFFEVFMYVFLFPTGVFLTNMAHSIFTIRSFCPAPQHKSSKLATFRTALVFAQEYGILAASAEDRPFVPVASVVICIRNNSGIGKDADEIPEGMRRAFRKWDDSVIGKCKVLPLTAALEATG